jgi:hypothetical protein
MRYNATVDRGDETYVIDVFYDESQVSHGEGPAGCNGWLAFVDCIGPDGDLCDGEYGAGAAHAWGNFGGLDLLCWEIDRLLDGGY